jgi:hypothetical protein
MNDPHVVSLEYRLVVSEDIVRYIDPPPIPWNTLDFHAVLADGILTCKMIRHFASIQEARNVVEPYLRAWELEAALHQGHIELRFAYNNKAEIIDLNPVPSPPPGSRSYLKGLGTVTVIGSASLSTIVNRRTYPDPPSDFRVTPNVETMWHRYQGYLEGREPLQAMAYLCLTLLEFDQPSNSGPRRPSRKRVAAANKYNIDISVLEILGELTSTKGNPTTARKYEATLQELTGKERNWIDAAIRALIRRVGEYDPQKSLPPLTMQDLPSLT